MGDTTRDVCGAHAGPAHLDLEHELVASDAELGLEQDGELLLRDGLRPPPVRPLDPLERLQGRTRGLRDSGRRAAPTSLDMNYSLGGT